MEQEQVLMLPGAVVHVRVPRVHSPGVRANVGVAKGESEVIRYEIGTKCAPNSYQTCPNFMRIRTNSCLRLAQRLARLCHFSLLVSFGCGGCCWGGSLAT